MAQVQGSRVESQRYDSWLQVSRTSITSDIQYLREQAKGTIKEYVTEHLPEHW
jgi:hypothetical protein